MRVSSFSFSRCFRRVASTWSSHGSSRVSSIRYARRRASPWRVVWSSTCGGGRGDELDAGVGGDGDAGESISTRAEGHSRSDLARRSKDLSRASGEVLFI